MSEEKIENNQELEEEKPLSLFDNTNQDPTQRHRLPVRWWMSLPDRGQGFAELNDLKRRIVSRVRRSVFDRVSQHHGS